MAHWEEKRGKAAFENQDYTEALLRYERALNNNPGNVECWMNLAAIMFKNKCFTEVG